MNKAEIKQLDDADLVVRFEELAEDNAKEYDIDHEELDNLRQEILDRMKK